MVSQCSLSLSPAKKMALLREVTCREVLDKAQTSTVHHAELVKTLRALHDQTDLEEFFEAFLASLRAALVIVRKEPAAERVLDFVARFAASVAPAEDKLVIIVLPLQGFI